MRKPTKPPRETDLRYIALKVEQKERLLDLMKTARAEMAPRNFAERHLVDEMATARWRGMRTALMEKAVYDHQDARFQPEHGKDENGNWIEENEDIFHLAMAHAADRFALVLAALSRLDARFHRQFCSALRHFIALRRLNPFSPVEPTITNHKEETPCTPSPLLA